jgi:hypothetical protein
VTIHTDRDISASVGGGWRIFSSGILPASRLGNFSSDAGEPSGFNALNPPAGDDGKPAEPDKSAPAESGNGDDGSQPPAPENGGNPSAPPPPPAKDDNPSAPPASDEGQAPEQPQQPENPPHDGGEAPPSS